MSKAAPCAGFTTTAISPPRLVSARRVLRCRMYVAAVSVVRGTARPRTPAARGEARVTAASSAQTERVGVAIVAEAFSLMGWAFREQAVAC